MPEFDDTNKLAVWKKGQDAHPDAPEFKIDVNFEGRDFTVALWKKKESAHPKAPAWRGKIESAEPQAVGAGSSVAEDESPF